MDEHKVDGSLIAADEERIKASIKIKMIRFKIHNVNPRSIQIQNLYDLNISFNINMSFRRVTPFRILISEKFVKTNLCVPKAFSTTSNSSFAPRKYVRLTPTLVSEAAECIADTFGSGEVNEDPLSWYVLTRFTSRYLKSFLINSFSPSPFT